MAMAINDLLMDLNLQNTMSPMQIDRASELLVQKFNNLNPADVKLCFDKMRLGEYGEYYNRMDVQVLAKCLNTYFEDRLQAAEHLSNNFHQEQKTGPITMDVEKFGGIKGWYEHNRKVQEDLDKAAKAAKKERDDIESEQARKKAEEFRQEVLDNKPEGWEKPTAVKHRNKK